MKLFGNKELMAVRSSGSLDFLKAGFLGFAIFYIHLSLTSLVMGLPDKALLPAVAAVVSFFMYQLLKITPSRPPVFEVSRFIVKDGGSAFLFYGVTQALVFAVIMYLSAFLGALVGGNFSFSIAVYISTISPEFLTLLFILAYYSFIFYTYILNRYCLLTEMEDFRVFIPFIVGVFFSTPIITVRELLFSDFSVLKLLSIPLSLIIGSALAYYELAKNRYKKLYFFVAASLGAFVWSLGSLIFLNYATLFREVGHLELITGLLSMVFFFVLSFILLWRVNAFKKSSGG